MSPEQILKIHFTFLKLCTIIVITNMKNIFTKGTFKWKLKRQMILVH